MRGNIDRDAWLLAPARRPDRDLLATAIAVAVHAAIAAGLLGVNPSRLARHEPVVEMEVKDKPMPPPEIRAETPPPPAPEPEAPPKPRVVPRRLASAPRPPPVPPAPPPPNQEPPKPSDAPPVFGVTMSSVVSGDSAGMAVPVGNTLMTKERQAAKPGTTAQAYSGEGTHPFTPVADVYITDPPRVLHEVNSADIYPSDAYKMGIEGKVVLKVGINAKGDVVQVRVIGKAGNGFDEAARNALRQFKFSPARTSDGQAVDYSLTYTYVFDMSH
ncbi:MAG TPA: TonB family protein [Polyangia bacterium]|jgi:protein TonB|nr:TonB family protein [Polyangia bacterium]